MYAIRSYYVVKRIEESVISGKAAKEVLDYLLENGGDIDEVIEKLGLKQVSDTGALEALMYGMIPSVKIENRLTAPPENISRITSYNVCYTKLLRCRPYRRCLHYFIRRT